MPSIQRPSAPRDGGRISRKGSDLRLRLAAWQGTTLVDYPGRIAATLFTLGCDFRCPFCHNPELVLPDRVARATPLELDGVLCALEDRAGFLDGVVVTGGEPTLHPDLGAVLDRLKSLGFLVKLDTNGAHPDVVRDLLRDRLVDVVAMDVKSPPDRYETFAGVPHALPKVRTTLEFLREASIEVELRTTVAPGLGMSDLEAIVEWIDGAPCYVLQPYRPPQASGKEILDPAWSERSALDVDALRLAWDEFGGRFARGGVRA